MQPISPGRHLTEQGVAAALDPAGGGERGSTARAHAAGCSSCAEMLAAAEATDRAVAALLSTLDHPVPAVGMEAIVARAGGAIATTGRQAGGPAISPEAERRRAGAGATLQRRVRWSVGLATLGLATVAAAIIPRSPLRRLVARLWSPIAASPAAGRSQASGASSSPSPSSLPVMTDAPRGVAMVAGSSIDILFRARQPAGAIRISVHPDARIAVTASGDGATYTVGLDTIVIDNRGAPALSYDVTLPLAVRLPDVQIYVGRQLVCRRQPGPGPHAAGCDVPGADHGDGGKDVISFAQLPHLK